MTDYDYAVRTQDLLHGERIIERPTLAEAQAHRDHLNDSWTRSDNGLTAEVVARPDGSDGEWTVLTDADITRIQDEANEALGEALRPIVEANLGNLHSPL